MWIQFNSLWLNTIWQKNLWIQNSNMIESLINFCPLFTHTHTWSLSLRQHPIFIQAWLVVNHCPSHIEMCVIYHFNLPSEWCRDIEGGILQFLDSISGGKREREEAHNSVLRTQELESICFHSRPIITRLWSRLSLTAARAESDLYFS